jgi:hypothetical protein
MAHRGRDSLAAEPIQRPKEHQVKLSGLRVGKHPEVRALRVATGLMVNVFGAISQPCFEQ